MKLYISDLDGTLLNRDKKVSEYTRDTVNVLTANGVYFSIATARTAASAVKILSGVDINVPVILMNGVVIYDIRKGKYIKTEAVSSLTAGAVAGVLKEHGIYGFMYAVSGDKMVAYYERLNTAALQDFYNERVIKYHKYFVQTNSFLNKIDDNKIIYFALVDEQKPLSVISDALKRRQDTNINMVLYRDIYSENLWYLEVFSKNASKYDAVKYIREHYGFDRIIGFGDNFNDIPLYEACDEFYAVSNAVRELKEKATGIIDGNNLDGVARFIAEREGVRV